MNELYPWQIENWSLLQTQKASGRLAHGLLLTGVEGTGKRLFVEQFAQALLCKSPDMEGMACGQCASCHLFNAGTHPDIIRVSPEEDSKVIKIDQVRELATGLTMTSQYGGYRVAIIFPADVMNTAAANSLLKTLEEPPPNTILMLVTSQPMRLPATVRSRCQQLAFPLPASAVAIDWVSHQAGQSAQQAALLLSLASGAPLRALEIATEGQIEVREQLINDIHALANGLADPVKVANSWLKTGAKFPLYCLYSWLADMIRLKMASQPPYLANPDLAEKLRELAKRLNLTNLYEFLALARQAKGLLETQANDQMLLESVLIPWHQSGLNDN